MTKLAIPSAPNELEEMLADRAKVDALFAEGQFPDVIKQYAEAVAKRDGDIAAQVKEQTAAVLAEWLKAEGNTDSVKRLNLSPDKAPAPAHAVPTSNATPGAALNALFPDTAAFLRAIWHGQTGEAALRNRAEISRVQNSFGSTVPADGGFLIPETLRSELLRVSLETALVRPRARVIPMESLRVPFPMIDSTSNATNVYGGVTAYWTEESAALTESQANFGRVVLEAKKLTAYAEVPNELMSDSIISMQAFIDQIFPEALAWFEDAAFISGTGVGEPLGFMGAPATVSVTKEVGQTAATIVWENVIKAYARMLPTSLNRAVWVANIDTFPELATMALTVGTGGSAVWLTNGAAGPPMTLLGRPILFTEKVSTIGTVGDLSLVDFGYYLIGDRQSMTAMSSSHYKFGNDKTAIRFTERVDGRPWLQSAITPKNGTNTLSPFVSVATRA